MTVRAPLHRLSRTGRAAQFTQASRKKPVKAGKEIFQGKGHSNRNADTDVWENVNGGEGAESRGGRGGRGGRGVRGGRGERGGGECLAHF